MFNSSTGEYKFLLSLNISVLLIPQRVTECCTFSNREYVKSGLAELELWCCQAKEEYAGSAWDELKHIRQVVGFLGNKWSYRNR
ncbi:hypothetical protein ACS0TY_015507 [Phlomoides rotata]